MLEIGSKVRKLMVGIIVIFLLMLQTEVVLSSTRALSKSPEAGFSVCRYGPGTEERKGRLN